MRQGGDIAALSLLAHELINEGFVHAKDSGDLPLASVPPLHRFHYARSQV